MNVTIFKIGCFSAIGVLIVCLMYVWNKRELVNSIDMLARCQSDEIIIYLRDAIRNNESLEFAIENKSRMLKYISTRCQHAPSIDGITLVNPYGGPYEFYLTASSAIICTKKNKEGWLSIISEYVIKPEEVAYEISSDGKVWDGEGCRKLGSGAVEIINAKPWL